MDVERIIDDIEQLQEMFEAPDIRPPQRTRYLCCKSKAQRHASQQSVVSAVAGFWGLLPNRA